MVGTPSNSNFSQISVKFINSKYSNANFLFFWGFAYVAVTPSEV
jgi:hypothetical protein